MLCYGILSSTQCHFKWEQCSKNFGILPNATFLVVPIRLSEVRHLGFIPIELPMFDSWSRLVWTMPSHVIVTDSPHIDAIIPPRWRIISACCHKFARNIQPIFLLMRFSLFLYYFTLHMFRRYSCCTILKPFCQPQDFRPHPSLSLPVSPPTTSALVRHFR